LETSLFPPDTEGLCQHRAPVMTPTSCPAPTEQIPEGTSSKEGPASRAELEMVLAPSCDVRHPGCCRTRWAQPSPLPAEPSQEVKHKLISRPDSISSRDLALRYQSWLIKARGFLSRTLKASLKWWPTSPKPEVHHGAWGRACKRWGQQHWVELWANPHPRSHLGGLVRKADHRIIKVGKDL